jgi:hypothetical protein
MDANLDPFPVVSSLDNPTRHISAGASESDSSSDSSIEYEDEAGLVLDMQALLTDEKGLSNMTAVVGREREELAIHTQVLRARSRMLSTALQSPWRRRELELPSVEPDVMRDVLEFVYTGAVRLRVNCGSVVKVAAAAHYLGVQELELIAIGHIRKFLGVDLFLRLVDGALSLKDIAVPDSVTDVLAEFATRQLAPLLSSAALLRRHAAHPVEAGASAVTLVRTIWCLHARETALSKNVTEQDLASSATALFEWSSRYAARNAPEALPLIDDCTSESNGTAPCAAVDSDVWPLVEILDMSASAEEFDALISVLACAEQSCFARLRKALV